MERPSGQERKIFHPAKLFFSRKKIAFPSLQGGTRDRILLDLTLLKRYCTVCLSSFLSVEVGGVGVSIVPIPLFYTLSYVYGKGEVSGKSVEK